MAKTLYQKVKVTNKLTPEEGAWFARAKYDDVMDIDAMADHIMEHGSVWTDDVVHGVLRKFNKCMVEVLKDSKKVKLTGLGPFSIALKSKGAASAEDLTASNITGAVLRFSPDRSVKAGLKSKILRGKLNLTLDAPKTATSDATPDDNDEGNGNG